MWLLFSCPSQTASHRYRLLFTKYQYPASNKKHTSWIRAQKSLWHPPPLSQPDTHSEMTEHTQREHLAASGRTAALPQKWAREFSVSGFHFGSSSPGPCHHSSRWRCSEVATQPLPPQDSSAHSPALGMADWWLTAQPLFGNCPWRELPRPRSHPFPSQVSAHSDWPYCLHWGQLCAATPTPELAHGAGWSFVVTGISRGPLLQAEREASLCPMLLSSLPHPKSFFY